MIFDPRCRRASNKGAAAQAEHVTGTHLFEYLQDATAITAAVAVGKAGAVGSAESSSAAADIYKVRRLL